MISEKLRTKSAVGDCHRLAIEDCALAGLYITIWLRRTFPAGVGEDDVSMSIHSPVLDQIRANVLHILLAEVLLFGTKVVTIFALDSEALTQTWSTVLIRVDVVADFDIVPAVGLEHRQHQVIAASPTFERTSVSTVLLPSQILPS